MRPILEIKQLSCAYLKEKPVLEVKDLLFSTGQLTFILGRSGIGKSSLLEVAGLMRRPQGWTNGRLEFHHPTNELELLELWNSKEEEIANFRNKHLAFIFQETNFLDHFTCLENMLLPCLVQDMEVEEARSRVSLLMDSLSLPIDLNEAFPAFASGGQRQRMAFIRALASDFDILFGDEPTGNLDPMTANQLMKVLREHIHTRQRTGIVVSHDLSLAERFADQILVFSEGTEIPGCGTILDKHRFQRHVDGGWRSNLGHELEEGMEALLARLIGQGQNIQAT